jgi:hypothetical protein
MGQPVSSSLILASKTPMHCQSGSRRGEDAAIATRGAPKHSHWPLPISLLAGLGGTPEPGPPGDSPFL